MSITLSSMKLENLGPWFFQIFFSSITLFPLLLWLKWNIFYTSVLPCKCLQLFFFSKFSHCPQIDLFLLTYLHILFVIFILVLYSGYVLNLKCCIFHRFPVEILSYQFFLKFLCIATLNFDPLILVSNLSWGSLRCLHFLLRIKRSYYPNWK